MDRRRMIDREKVLTLLQRRFAGAPREQLAAAANAIVGLEDEWEELAIAAEHAAGLCVDRCCLADQTAGGAELRVFRRRGPEYS